MGKRRGQRRPARLVATVLAVVTLAAAAGCAEGFTGNELRSTAEPDTARPADVRAIAPTVTGLGADVLGTLAATEVGNVGVSPSALAAQLSMVAAGAGSSSAAALDALLGGTGLSTATAGRTTLAGAVVVPTRRNGTQRSPQRSGPVDVDTAVALWIQRGPTVATTFLDELAVSHDTGVRQLDFRSDPEGARAAVNLWTAGATEGTVTEVAPGGTVTNTTRLLSTAAQTVSAPWLIPFDPQRSAPAPFTTASGEVVEVTTMEVDAPSGLRWGRGPGWQAVGLPYLGRELMVVLALADPGAPALSERLDTALVTGIIASLRPEPLNLRVPRLSLALDVSLAPALGSLGAGVVFDTDLADLTPAAPAERLALTDVLQALRLTIDEEGSGGRAATVTTPGAATGTSPARRISIDRPFLAMVVDVPTRTPLLMAEVVDPS